MGGYGYNQGTPSQQGGGSENTQGEGIGKLAQQVSTASTVGSQMSANAAAQAGYAETTGIAGGASTAAGSAAASGAVGAGTGAVAGGATGSTIAGEIAVAMLFYGGETVSQIKARIKVPIIGGPEGTKTSEDKKFYKNVVIPRKKV